MRFSSYRTMMSLVGMICAMGILSAAAQEGKAPKTKITAEQANAIALKKFPGKVEGKTPLENEEGKWQYGVMVRSGKKLREVMVDANTGKIASVEVTTPKEEEREARADAAKAKKKAHKK